MPPMPPVPLPPAEAGRHLYRISIHIAGGARTRYSAFFASSVDAVVQTLQRFPQASGISCIRVLRRDYPPAQPPQPPQPPQEAHP